MFLKSRTIIILRIGGEVASRLGEVGGQYQVGIFGKSYVVSVFRLFTLLPTVSVYFCAFRIIAILTARVYY